MIDEIIDRITRYIEEKYKRYDNDDEIHVSEISRCLRLSYIYRKNEIKRDISELIYIFYGDILHGFKLLSDSKKEFVLILESYPVKIIGTIDEIYNDVIIEKKFTKSSRYLVKTKEPYITHLNQLLSYMALYYKCFNKIPKGYLIYFCYEDKSIISFEIILNEEDIKKILNTIILRAFKLFHSLKYDKEISGETSSICKLCKFEYNCPKNDTLKKFINPYINIDVRNFK